MTSCTPETTGPNPTAPYYDLPNGFQGPYSCGDEAYGLPPHADQTNTHLYGNDAAFVEQNQGDADRALNSNIAGLLKVMESVGGQENDMGEQGGANRKSAGGHRDTAGEKQGVPLETAQAGVKRKRATGLSEAAEGTAEAPSATRGSAGRRKRQKSSSTEVDERLGHADDGATTAYPASVLAEARVVGVHSAAALFRGTSVSTKKYTRPPMSKLYSSLRLTPDNFLHLQAAAKQYMLDTAHPERQDCVGQRGKGDTDIVRLRLFNCVREFLNEGSGDKFFGPNACTEDQAGDGVGFGVNDNDNRKWIWPHDGNKIISLITPLLRRMVTNERQRQYALVARKSGNAKAARSKEDIVDPQPSIDETPAKEPSTAVSLSLDPNLRNSPQMAQPYSSVPIQTYASFGPPPATLRLIFLDEEEFILGGTTITLSNHPCITGISFNTVLAEVHQSLGRFAPDQTLPHTTSTATMNGGSNGNHPPSSPANTEAQRLASAALADGSFITSDSRHDGAAENATSTRTQARREIVKICAHTVSGLVHLHDEAGWNAIQEETLQTMWLLDSLKLIVETTLIDTLQS